MKIERYFFTKKSWSKAKISFVQKKHTRNTNQLWQTISTLLLFFLFCAFENNNKKKADVEKDDLKGKVKEIKEDIYFAKEKLGEIVIGAKCNTSISYLKKFDNKGNEIELTKYNWNGSAFSTVTCKYDEKGGKIEESLWQMGHKCLHSTNTYKYDEKGNLIQQNTYYFPDSLKQYQTLNYSYKYDGKGNIIEENTHANGNITIGRISNRTTYKYDTNGNMIEKNLDNGDYKFTWEYNGAGNKLEENYYIKYYNDDRSSYYKINYNYKYDGKGNIIEENGSDSYSYMSLCPKFYEYDGHGKRIKCTWSPDSSSSAFSQIVYKYDEKGNQIEESRWLCLGEDENGIKELYRYGYEGNKYEYDEHGNWIKKIEFINDTPRFITIRGITYY